MPTMVSSEPGTENVLYTLYGSQVATLCTASAVRRPQQLVPSQLPNNASDTGRHTVASATAAAVASVTTAIATTTADASHSSAQRRWSLWTR